MLGEAAKICKGARFEAVYRGRPKFSHRREDSAAGFGNLLVGGPGDAAVVLVGAAIRKNEVRVRIDEPGEDNAIAEVELFGLSRESVAFDFVAWTDGDDALVLDK